MGGVRSGVRCLPGMVHTAPEPRCRPCAWKETSSVWKTPRFLAVSHDDTMDSALTCIFA